MFWYVHAILDVVCDKVSPILLLHVAIRFEASVTYCLPVCTSSQSIFLYVGFGIADYKILFKTTSQHVSGSRPLMNHNKFGSCYQSPVL
jgi:hypothetical protein